LTFTKPCLLATQSLAFPSSGDVKRISAAEGLVLFASDGVDALAGGVRPIVGFCS